MKLRYSPASPYVRKVSVTALELGLGERIENLPTDTGDKSLSEVNPLGKVPALTTDDGDTLCESPVICEYLDALAGPKLFPPAGPARWRALNLAALGDGVMDAALARLLEVRLRPEGQRSEGIMKHQKGKIGRTLDLLERQAAEGALAEGESVTIGEVCLGVALGYLDFRFDADRWRDGRPALAGWYEGFAARPSMQATMPKAPTS